MGLHTYFVDESVIASISIGNLENFEYCEIGDTLMTPY